MRLTYTRRRVHESPIQLIFLSAPANPLPTLHRPHHYRPLDRQLIDRSPRAHYAFLPAGRSLIPDFEPNARLHACLFRLTGFISLRAASSFPLLFTLLNWHTILPTCVSSPFTLIYFISLQFRHTLLTPFHFPSTF
jgi:hypothetical protein